MAKFTVSRYVVVTTEIEAETPEQALALECQTDTKVELTSEAGFNTTYWWSENGAWVDDEDGDTVLEG
jgi:hypothetical protein